MRSSRLSSRLSTLTIEQLGLAKRRHRVHARGLLPQMCGRQWLLADCWSQSSRAVTVRFGVCKRWYIRRPLWSEKRHSG